MQTSKGYPMTSDIIPLNSHHSKPGRFRGGEHKPLMAMVEITNRCNMHCPLCFTAASKNAEDVPVEEIKARLTTLLETAGPIPLQISGGEPTLHPHLPEIITCARILGFTNIELVTNGILISRNPSFLTSLAECGLTAVYLQFDGVTRKTYETIRGQDMSEVRHQSVESIRAAGLCCTLAVAVLRGVNDQELGAIIDFAVTNIDTVRAINFQAATRFTGRYAVGHRPDHYRLSELVNLIEDQAGLQKGGFLSDVLGHTECNAMSLVYLVAGTLEPLFAHVSKETRDKFLGADKRQILLDLFKGKNYFCHKYFLNPQSWALLFEATAVLGKKGGLQSLLKARHLLLFAKSFMERSAFNTARLDTCCYGIAARDGVYSFCAYNNLYRTPQTKNV